MQQTRSAPGGTVDSTGAAGGVRASGRIRASGSWRGWLTCLLGLAWLVDAALQYQPYMFTKAFPHDIIRPTAAGNPGWVRGPIDWSATLMSHHLVLLNAAFASLQLVIALGLLWRRTRKPALVVSIAWALSVWWMGEGLGGILIGPVSLLDGLPGGALLYAVIAVLLWPRRSAPEGSAPRSVATDSPLGRFGALGLWVVLWAWFAIETLLPANRAAGAMHDTVAGMADGEPHWIRSINTWGADLLAGRGLAASIVLAVCLLLIAGCLFVPSLTRPGLVLAIALSLVIWVVAQDFGEIATGTATDVNAAPLLALLALCYWPTSRRRTHRPLR
ncbi:hypothetical protein [Leekyejoonella antrihumi]|uniref:Uncharacterized protein n=1 Tax=Leekyejoonella antrihumi TaxID=1660198 RepID=A0A563DYC6_9MICO|nr:hypothetical protein [Leekyejoonella antrihumi]TWP34953.1 hypothetical protein FGL98_15530 [Leekyejoonella antrihumi]